MTLEDILVVEMVCHQEPGRSGEAGEGREAADYDSGSEGPCYSGTETGNTHVGK